MVGNLIGLQIFELEAGAKDKKPEDVERTVMTTGKALLHNDRKCCENSLATSQG
jgi:hypothetical protein